MAERHRDRNTIVGVCIDHGVVVKTCSCSNPHSARFVTCPKEKCPGWGTGAFLPGTRGLLSYVPSVLLATLREKNTAPIDTAPTEPPRCRQGHPVWPEGDVS